MGVALSSSESHDGKRQARRAHEASNLHVHNSAFQSKRTSTPETHACSASEVSVLPQVMTKEEEDVSASCALSCTASMKEFITTTSSHRTVTPHLSNGSVEPQRQASPAELHAPPMSTASRPTLQTQQQQQQQELPRRRSRRVSHTPTNATTPLDGVDVVQIEHTSPHSAGLLPPDLDDFELAYSRSVQNGNVCMTAAAESFAVVQYIRPMPRPASHGVAGLGMSASGASRSFSAPELAVTYPPLYTPSEVDETLAFVTLRRTGFSGCRICGSGLPHRAKFCPECGTSVAQGWNCDESSPIGARRVSSSCASSSLLAAPSFNSQSGGSEGSSANTTTPLTPMLEDRSTAHAPASPAVNDAVVSALEESNVFTLQRRHAFVRYVKVLRSRDMLGAGTSGTVYRAFDTRTGQQLAVKESLINQNAPEELAAVRNELRQLAELRHPYIVEYFGCRVEAVEENYVAYFQSSLVSSHASAVESRQGSRRKSAATQRAASLPPIISRVASAADAAVEGRRRNLDLISPVKAAQSPPHPRRRKSVTPSTIRVLMLMERVECGTLHHLIADFPRGMPEQAVRRFAAQLVDAVRYVHECGLSHRDIKLDNILLASDGTIRLSDFGCAVRGVSGLSTNGISSIAGTPAYMPPESLANLTQASVDWTAQGMAQDVWAIGCVVHHLLTAESPWQHLKSLSPYALLLHIQANEFPLQAKLLSRDALDFCRRCLERDPAYRITTAELARHPFVNQPRGQSRAASMRRVSQSGSNLYN